MAVPLTVGGVAPRIGSVPSSIGSWVGTGYNPNPYSSLGTTHAPIGGAYGTGVPHPADTPVTPYSAAGVNVAPQTYGTAGGTSGGVDWASMIGGSYEVAQAEAMMAAEKARARANLQNSLRMNLIDLGIGDKSQLGDLSQYIDKDTLKQAIANKYSTYAQVADQQARANATNAAQLASRGILSSGQTTKSTQDVVNQGEQARYSGLRDFLRSGQTGLEHMGDVESQMAQGVMQARFAAAQRLANQYAMAGADPGGGGSAPPPSAPAASVPYSPYTDPYFPGGPAAPNYPLVGTNSSAWQNWLKEHGTSGY